MWVRALISRTSIRSVKPGEFMKCLLDDIIESDMAMGSGLMF